MLTKPRAPRTAPTRTRINEEVVEGASPAGPMDLGDLRALVAACQGLSDDAALSAVIGTDVGDSYTVTNIRVRGNAA